MSYSEFCAGDVSPHSFILGQAFHCPSKPPFSWFVQVIAWAQAILGANYCRTRVQIKEIKLTFFKNLFFRHNQNIFDAVY